MKTVKVYDAIMGSGKTYDAIERMKNYLEEDEKFIYITPFLSEIERIKSALKSDDVFAPLNSNEVGLGKYEIIDHLMDENDEIDLNAKKSYRYLNKRAQFLNMASEGRNIISTHSLFMSLKKEDYDLFSDYILILDEVVNPLNVMKIGAEDIQILRNEELIFVNPKTNEVRFIKDDYSDQAFKHVKILCSNSSVFYLDKYFFAWIFPFEIFRGFKEVQILTYLFEGSLLSAYFKMYNIDYETKRSDSTEQLKEIKSLLNIYIGRANSFNSLNAFSKTWINNLSKASARKIAYAVSNTFTRVFQTSTKQNAFTTFKDFKSKLAGKGYTKGFIPINARASNDYNHIESMAFLGNRFFDPQTISFFRERSIALNEDLWALSELIQWVWRGCIRDGKQMNLFIPSNRMRELLLDWLDGNYLPESISSSIKIEN